MCWCCCREGVTSSVESREVGVFGLGFVMGAFSGAGLTCWSGIWWLATKAGCRLWEKACCSCWVTDWGRVGSTSFSSSSSSS